MIIYLGLGSNLGDRREHLLEAVRRLEGPGLRVLRVSPVVESPALLPQGAPADWNRPFLNLAVECDADCAPRALLERAARIEAQIGRVSREQRPRWSPRSIDIDILLWGEEIVSTPDLVIPHSDLHRRSFVLTPLIALEPALTIPGRGPRTLLQWSMALEHHIPLWMGIVNVTPDSFSDGGLHTDWASVEPLVEEMVGSGAHILDVGAQSTRPEAVSIGSDIEWSRLAPVLEPLLAKYARQPLRPLISVDTYHAEVAERALDLGIDIVNDVSGLTAPGMIDLARSGGADWIAMHQLTLPVDRNVTLPPNCDPVEEVENWLAARLEGWTAAGVDLDRVVFDPGIGFGKDPLQSLTLLRAAGRFRKYGLRTLVGHSRKSFLNDLLPAPLLPAQEAAERRLRDRDLATIGAALALCRQGVDILRVHNVVDHIAAYRGWSHVAN